MIRRVEDSDWIGKCVITLIALGSLTVVGGCRSSAHHVVRVARVTHFANPQAGFTPTEEAEIDDNCPAGMPKKDPAFEHGPTEYVIREGYVLEHSSADKIALWVCEHVTPEELAGDVKRRDKFKPDPQLAKGERAELADYRGSGFDRGHQAPAGDQKSSQRLNDETFYLSNMAPQVGRGFNRGVWRALEEMVRTWTEEQGVGDVYVITGGLFYDPAEDDSSTADGLIDYSVIGKNAVAVPTHFYKIVVAHQGEQWKAVAFVLTNTKQDIPDEFSPFVRSIRWVEEQTGLDFMPNLDLLTAESIEASPGTLWGGSH